MLLRNAVARGELPAETDIDLVAEIPAAIIWHHVLNHLTIKAGVAERIVDHILDAKGARHR